MELPEQCMEEGPVVGQRMTTAAVVVAVWQEGGQTLPLGIGKLIALADGASPRRTAPS
jgi:hypothetical protein